MSTTYKLTYFSGRGRAELTRLVFVTAGLPYEDIRIEESEWPALKPNTPFGQLPMLEVDGVKLCQSNTIARYLARKFNLAGKTELDQARADMIVDCTEDIIKPLLAFAFGEDEAKKAELKSKYVAEQLPNYLTLLEGILKTNNDGEGFLVGDGLTWADLCVLTLYDWLTVGGAEAEFAKHPRLNALHQRVAKVPRVAEWLAKRPVTDY